MPPVAEQVKDVNKQIQGEMNSAVSAIGQVPAPQVQSTASPSVSTDDLTGTIAPVDGPSFTPPSLAGIVTSANNRLTSTQAELGSTKSNNDAITQQILGLQNELLDEPTRQAQLEQEAQLGERRRRLSELTSGISSSLADLQAFDAETENMLEQFRGQGNGVAANIIDRKNSERRRQRNLDKLTQAASLARQVSAADLLAGEITTAQANIDKAVELEFAPLRKQIETAKWLLERSDAGLERLTDAERAEYSNFIQANEAFIADKKQTDRDILAIADEAIRNGASQAEANQILNAQSPQEAQSIASPYIGLLDRQTQQLQQANIRDQMRVRNEELNLAKAKASEATLNQYGTLDGKPQTTTQATANGYADRLVEAGRILDQIEDQFTGDLAFGGILPNVLQSSERQQFEQAKRNFVNSVLRRESGAVISDQEFENAEKQYFAQPGDSEQTLLQKAINRNTVINNFYREANVPRPVFPGDRIVSDGVEYIVGDDGETIVPAETTTDFQPLYSNPMSTPSYIR